MLEAYFAWWIGMIAFVAVAVLQDFLSAVLCIDRTIEWLAGNEPGRYQIMIIKVD